MTREKQIEEMTVELAKINCNPKGCFGCNLCDEYGSLELNCEDYLYYRTMAKTLYNAGYRKQSVNTVEVVRCKDCEYFEDDAIDDIHQYFCNKYDGMLSPTPDAYCSCGELKMKGGAE